MRRASRSIRLRLILAGAATIIAALGAAGVGLDLLFARHVERRAVAELQTDLQQLVAGVAVAPDGAVTLERGLGDQRFQQPFSGLYWQISRGDAPIERSRSLWDEALALPDDVLAPDGYHTHRLAGPAGQPLLVVERMVSVRRGEQTFAFRVSAAVDRREILQAVADFRVDLLAGLTALGALLFAAFAVALHIGLRPLEGVRSALAALRSGRERRLTGAFPSEVRPLVDDLNALLDTRDASLARARARAADLAHGLKTPLAAISVLTEDLRARGDAEMAGELARYAAAMTGHVERELTRARVAEAQIAATPIPLKPLLETLIRTMKRLPRGAEIDWILTADPALSARADEAALAELFGNLLDNARKWAAARVTVTATEVDGRVALRIADDGRGVPPEARDAALARGRRLDESVPGSGFGLPIAVEIAEQLGGSLTLSETPGGGLTVEISLPGHASES